MTAGKNWGIVGGGMLGMTLALRLAQGGNQVTLFEAASQLGGLAGAWHLGDVVWDRHYHVTALSDTSLRGLLTELGLEDEMRWVETRTGCYTDGSLYSVSNVVEFLRFPPLTMIDKLRLGWTVLYASKIRNWRRLEEIEASRWLARWSGHHAFENFWQPLLKAKLGENERVASAAFIWAVIQRLYKARRTGLKTEMFGYVPGGYARILARLGEVLSSTGVEVVLGSKVQGVRSVNGRPVVSRQGSPDRTFDGVVVTTAAPIAAYLVDGLSDPEAQRLNAIPYQGVVCASLLTKRPLEGFYVTNITDESVLTGVIEMTAVVDPRDLGGHHLIYLPRYVTSADPLLEAPESEVEEAFLSDLERIYPDFDRGDVLAFRLSRVRYVMAVSTIGYSRFLPPTMTSVPGVHIVNSAHIVNGTLNVNETVELAERAAVDLMAPTAIDSQLISASQ